MHAPREVDWAREENGFDIEETLNEISKFNNVPCKAALGSLLHVILGMKN